MKKTVNMCEENRKFIQGLLGETREDFRQAFRDLAKANTIKGKRKFVSHWCQLAELAYVKTDEEPTEEGGNND